MLVKHLLDYSLMPKTQNASGPPFSSFVVHIYSVRGCLCEDGVYLEEEMWLELRAVGGELCF